MFDASIPRWINKIVIWPQLAYVVVYIYSMPAMRGVLKRVVSVAGHVVAHQACAS
jgi:hypothetical protein